jgi:sulfoxide reductase heme-binding subunit YedZ
MKLLKPALFLACLIPVALLLWATLAGRLSANPLEDIRDNTGIWTLRFLLLTLAITPLRRVTGWHHVIRFRRMLGVFAFFYALLHFITYVWLDQFFAFDEMLRDLAKRRFIMAGYASLALLIPLAITSTKAWIGRLGG